ncbi:MAG: hypothetical protein LBH75_09310 [Treponema sp.]|jgi:hypothetical protein|nr:hypothetical protein [Treponema sp.]
MKKTTLIMTTAVIAALSLLIGCGDGGDDETPTGYQNPKESSTSFQTFYIKAVDAAREDPWKDIADLNRLHFHAPAGTGFVIQKIFLSDTMSKEVPADATVWYDFTAGESLEDCTKGNYGGTMANGGIQDGAWVLENTGTGEVYPGNLGLALDGKVYVGFIIKNVSEDLKFDNILLEFRYTGDASYTSLSFANFFGLETTEPIDPDPGPNPGPGETPDPVLTSEFATYYLDISGISGLTGFRIKNTSGADAGIIIDEIFASGDMSEADKAVAFDFEEPEGGTNWWGFSTGTKADGAWSSGEQATDSHDIAAFGSEVFNGKQYLGIKAKNLSEAVKGDTLLIAPLTENGEVAEFTKTFAELFVAGIPASIPVLGAEFATYYLDIAATEFDGVDGIHFHNKTANELGMVVDRIFATNTLGVAEAVILEFDGTDKSAEDDAENGSYYWSGLSGTDGTATAGAAAGEGNYAYIGGFATPLFAGKAYIGIVAKNVSSTVKGDEITVQPIISGEVDDSKSKTFAELFSR